MNLIIKHYSLMTLKAAPFVLHASPRDYSCLLDHETKLLHTNHGNSSHLSDVVCVLL